MFKLNEFVAMFYILKKMENRESVNRYIESTLINKVVESLMYRENYYLINYEG